MARWRSLLVTVLLLALPMVTSAGADPRFQGPAPPPGELGPWAVGRTTISVVDPTRFGRTLPVDVWYPVDPADAVGPPSRYDLIFAGIDSTVALDSPVPSSAGPFPLIVFSHGNAGIRFQSFFLMEHLASHGFVVAAPDHVGNTAVDLIAPGSVFFRTRDRPLDISLVITRMLERNATGSGDAFEGRIDPVLIGVVGHSFGGFTALAMATGYEDVPRDPRVRVILPISPASGLLSDEELSSIWIPILLLGGTADTTTPIDPQTTRPWALLPGGPRFRIDVVNAGHNSFTDICPIGDALLGAGLPASILDFLLGNLAEACSPALIPIARAHELTDLYVTAFLKRKLVNDPRYREFLTPEFAVALGDVIYFPESGCPSGPGALALMPLAVAWSFRRRRAVSWSFRRRRLAGARSVGQRRAA